MPCFLCGGRSPEATGVAVAAPPRPDETPVTSNRKGGREQQRQQQQPLEAATSNAEEDFQDGGRFHKELEASVQQRSSNNNGVAHPPSSGAVKKKKVYHNIHPVQENVQAKMDWFESAFGLNGKKATNAMASAGARDLQREEPTDTDLTETETGDEALWHKRSSDSEGSVRDCEDDPYEYAYKVWYRKGLLNWRPKSIPDPNPAAAEPTPATAKESAPGGEPANHHQKDATAANDAPQHAVLDEDAAILQKFHQHGKTKTCLTCHKDTSLQIEMVQCNYCELPLYCSVFCRGNDRYKHAATCQGKQHAKVPWKAATVAPAAKGDIDENASPEKEQQRPRAAPSQQNKKKRNTVADLVGPPTDTNSHTPSKQRSIETTQRAPMVSLFAGAAPTTTSSSAVKNEPPPPPSSTTTTATKTKS